VKCREKEKKKEGKRRKKKAMSLRVRIMRYQRKKKNTGLEDKLLVKCPSRGGMNCLKVI